MGETRVDLLHLLQDLADAYPGELEETVLTEVIANALDSRAATIAISVDTAAATLTVVDDGTGMRRADLRRFHDVASSTKERGDGIGFAGVGIKLGLLISDTVVTETRRGAEHVATTWAMSTRKRAPWQWIAPPGMVPVRGTAVRLYLSNALSPLLDRGYVESRLREHFEPLFDPYFDEILRSHYPKGVRLTIDDAMLARSHDDATPAVPLELRLPRKRLASAFGYVARQADPFATERRGIAISTYGKVIKRGWDWLGVSPATADRVSGLVEVPALSAALTLNKADFLRSGSRGALYLSYRKALQEAVMSQLAAWGDALDAEGRTRRRAARPVERDLEAILADLSDQFPILATLVERRAGGKRRIAVATRDGGGEAEAGVDLFTPAADVVPEPVLPAGGTETSPPEASRPPEDGASSPSVTAAPISAAPPSGVDRGRRSRQPLKLGLTIQFEARPDDPELARLIESTVWVNEAHPAHRRAVSSRSEGYHLALSVAIALASVAVEPANERAFITEFLARWGEAVEGGARRLSRRGSRGRKGR
jgi:hypothetical protein